MGVATLTSAERVTRMFDRRDQDRIPRNDSYWGETIRRWQDEGLEGGAGQVLQQLGDDFRRLCWSWPAPFPGQAEVLAEDEQTRVVRDQFGQTTRTWKHKSGTPEHLGWVTDSREYWERVTKPAWLATPLAISIDDTRKAWEAGRRDGKWCHLAGVETFEATRKIMGDEVTLMAMALDPDWIVDVSHTHTDLLLRDYDAIWEAGIRPDGIWIYADMAFKSATMCSPAMYRELIWPDHKRIADWAHAHGLRMIFHTDGNVNGVLDDYVAAGFDCLQPLEAKAGMDIRQMCPRYGDRLATFGNIDVMILGSNDRDRIEEEIRSKLAAGMATKGYAYHSDHSVPPTVSWDTYQFVMACVERYGTY